MSRRTILIGTLFAAITIFALRTSHFALPASLGLTTPDFSGRPADARPILTPCSRFDDRYDDLKFSKKYVRDWPDIYHKRVDDVVEEYVKPITMECSAENYDEFAKAGPELEKLARDLPIWEDTDVPLSRFDTPRVLLEYLRIYECALTEFDTLLYFDTTKEIGQDDPSLGIFDIFFTDMMKGGEKRKNTIDVERATARKAMERTLKLLGTFDRLRPLEAELECLQRTSLDIRNIAALTAETSSCLPRTWNAKDPLRDYREDE